MKEQILQPTMEGVRNKKRNISIPMKKTVNNWAWHAQGKTKETEAIPWKSQSATEHWRLRNKNKENGNTPMREPVCNWPLKASTPWFDFDFTSNSLGHHFDFTSASLQGRLNFVSISLRYRFNVTYVSAGLLIRVEQSRLDLADSAWTHGPSSMSIS